MPQIQVFDPSPVASQSGNLGRALGQFGSDFLQGRQEAQQQSQLASALFGDQGEDYSSLPINTQMQLAQMRQNQQIEQQKMQLKQAEQQTKLNEKVQPIIGAREVIQRMRDIGANGRLGRGSGIWGLLGGETSRDRGEYEQLGKSLISYATSIPIRNRIEFETLAEKLYDPSLPDKEREGVLDAMERILNNSLQSVQSEMGGQQPQQPQQAPQNRPPLESFMRAK